jgi:hypothetical protein
MRNVHFITENGRLPVEYMLAWAPPESTLAKRCGDRTGRAGAARFLAAPVIIGGRDGLEIDGHHL